MRRMGIVVPLMALSGLPTVAFSQQIQRQAVTADAAFVARSLEGPSRKIMRLSDGRIYASFAGNPDAANQIRLFAASERKQSWDDVSGRELAAVKAQSVSSDTGPNGTFVSFVNGTSYAGEILLFPDPVTSPGRFVRFGALTRAAEQVSDGFVAASKGDESTNSVAYGWRDTAKNTLLVGYSPDGRQFPEARAVVSDPALRSGPLVAIHNRYILVAYLSADPRYRPANAASDAGAYPAYVESWDGGQTWSPPTAVLGTDPKQFPKVDYAHIGAKATEVSGNLLAVGGSSAPSNVLAWAQAGIGARIFVLTEQALVSSDPSVENALKANPVTVGVLAFKDLSDGPEAPWNTVVASVPPANAKRLDVPASSNFQYSALPGTSIRAVSYRRAARQQTRDSEGIVVSVSTNTGQSFDRSVFIPKSALGLDDKFPLIFTASACVAKNDKGDLFLDVAYLDTANKIQTAQLPLNYNLSQLPPSMFNIVAKWP